MRADSLVPARPVLVAGGINADVLGRPYAPMVLHTSNPARAGVTPGGVGRNIAAALARLRPAALPVRLLGAVGTDVLGAGVLEATRAAGVDVGGVLQLPGQTGLYLAVLDHTGELHLGLAAMDITETLTPEQTAPWLPELDSAQLLIVDANLPPATVAALLQRAHRAGVRVIAEPVSAPKAARLARFLNGEWHGTFLITPDQAELQALTGRQDRAGAVQMLLDGGVQHVLLTLGRRGSVLYSRGAQHQTPAAEVAVQDVTGAGDALVAGLSAGLLRGLSLQEAVRCGHACAALTVASAQTVPDTLSWARLQQAAARVP